MKKLPHLLAALAAVALLVALSGPWWVLEVPTGARVSVTGWSASQTATALLVALAAAYAAGLLTRGLLRRIIALLQVGLGAGVIATWWAVVADPVASQSAAITTLTGLSGELSLQGVSAGSASALVWLGFAGAAIAVGSGVFALFVAEGATGRSRYERSGPGVGDDPIDTWDALSEGSDPTSR